MIENVGMMEPDGFLGGIMGRENGAVFQILTRDEFVCVEAHRLNLDLKGYPVEAKVPQQILFKLRYADDDLLQAVLDSFIAE